jgi:hypothetical protein
MPIAQAVAAAPRRIAATTGIAQDNIIFAGIMFAFVVWITTKGELPTYLKFFTPGANPGPPVAKVSATSSSGGGGGGVAPAATTANPNPGLLGSSNPVGGFTFNPTTLFGALPTLQAIPGNLLKNFGLGG